MKVCDSLLFQYKASREDSSKVEVINSMIRFACIAKSHILFDNFSTESVIIQEAVVFSMRIIANKKSKLLLENLLVSSHIEETVRAALTEVVGDLNLVQCTPVLKCQLSDPSPLIRYWSCASLGMVGSREDRELLQAMLSDGAIGFLDETVSDAASRALEFIGAK